ncbi:FUSC family protein [Anseongella ginsenosidimutans]|uniref:FUSC family protein n=1 Tax=Anseongella ginsenosidimutans TaxID=496056 RepID=UPI001315245F|nr:FUSC family membrane protein [Anseongella ginsenosidimutans]
MLRVLHVFYLWGRASNIGTACLLAMVFSVEGVRDFSQSLEYAGFMLAGGIWYFLLSVVLWQIRPYFSARQGLADCLLETAEYMRIKAAFYQNNPDFDKNFRKLVDIQIQINEKQEEVRELLLKRRSAIQGSNSVSRSLVMIFIESVDLLEQVMASHIDYRLLHARFEKTGILLQYRELIIHMANELEDIAAAVLSASRSYPRLNLGKEIEAVRHEVDDLKEEMLNSDTIDEFIALKNILRNAAAISGKIRMLHHYTHPDRKEARSPLGKDVELTRFTSHQRYDFGIFRSNLTFDSSSFRHSLRVTLAAVSGYLVSLMMAQDHSYWILMTVIIIMKPAFGSTKKRIYERLLGTVLGGLAGVGILVFVSQTSILLIILLLFIFLAFTFINYNYRLAVVFITPYVLILFQLLDPGNFEVVRERVIDTIIGGGIAFIASYVLWPSWEYLQLKTYLLDILEANREYFKQVARAYAGEPLIRTEYKLARKQVHVSTANIASALQRMLSEPKSKHKNASEIYSFVVLNHTLSSHIATLVVLLNRKPEQFEQKGFAVVIEKILGLLEQAGTNLKEEETESIAIELPEEFRLLDQKLHLLAEERMNEVRAGEQASKTQEELSLLQSLFDTFKNILTISAEISKHSQKIRV